MFFFQKIKKKNVMWNHNNTMCKLNYITLHSPHHNCKNATSASNFSSSSPLLCFSLFFFFNFSLLVLYLLFLFIFLFHFFLICYNGHYHFWRFSSGDTNILLFLFIFFCFNLFKFFYISWLFLIFFRNQKEMSQSFWGGGHQFRGCGNEAA